MPYRILSPEATLFALAVAGILSLFGRKRKSSSRSLPEIWAPRPLSIPIHEGLRSLTHEVFILNFDFAKKTFAYPIGSPLTLSLKDDKVYLAIAGRKYWLHDIPRDSELKSVLAEGKPYYVYIKERDGERFIINDIFTVIIFY